MMRNFTLSALQTSRTNSRRRKTCKKRVKERHKIVLAFLVELGVDEANAEIDSGELSIMSAQKQSMQ